MAFPASTTCTLTRKRITHLTHGFPRTYGFVTQWLRSCSTTWPHSRRSHPSLRARRTRMIPRVKRNPHLKRSRSPLIRSRCVPWPGKKGPQECDSEGNSKSLSLLACFWEAPHPHWRNRRGNGSQDSSETH